MSHPLDGARARIERANKHLRELASLVETYWNAYANGFTVNEHPEVRSRAVITGRLMPPLPIEMALLVSDAIHNFRSALDYVIYELAIHDSGTIQQGTQFIIENSPKSFAERSPRYLKGLTNQHITAVERLQPYNGVQWTKILRDISNPDKHRKLVLVEGAGERLIQVKADTPGSFDGLPGKIFRAVGRDGSDVYVEFHSTGLIQFADGLTVVETLDVLKSQIVDAIQVFQPEFTV